MLDLPETYQLIYLSFNCQYLILLDLQQTMITSNSADISWSPGGSESQWLFNGNVVNINQTLTALNGATSYDVIDNHLQVLVIVVHCY